MAVALNTPVERLGLKEKDVVFLKIFDRRFTARVQVESGARPWTMETERKYQQLILDTTPEHDPSGDALLRTLHFGNKQGDKENSGWTEEAGKEASLAFSMREYFRNELEAYGWFGNLLGKCFPLVHSTVRIAGTKVVDGLAGDDRYTYHPGFMMQHIDGFNLTDIVDHAPREAWQGICDAAVGIVEKYFHDMINEDISHRNFIVRKRAKEETELQSKSEKPNVGTGEKASGDYEVFMVDFVLSKVKDNSGILFWDEEKARYDEEGAVGYDMEEYLAGGYVYHRSKTYLELDETYPRDQHEQKERRLNTFYL